MESQQEAAPRLNFQDIQGRHPVEILLLEIPTDLVFATVLTNKRMKRGHHSKIRKLSFRKNIKMLLQRIKKRNNKMIFSQI